MELLVVLAVLVLLAAAWPFAAPRLFPTQQLRNAAQRFVSDVRMARTTARSTNTAQGIDIASAGDSYQTNAGIHEASRGITLQLRGDPSIEKASKITLYPDGSSSGGIVDIALPDHTLSVSIGVVTGRTEILE
jgi:type II secretory pathway pseudopilin PulG